MDIIYTYVLFFNNYFINDDNILSIILDTKGEEQWKDR